MFQRDLLQLEAKFARVLEKQQRRIEQLEADNKNLRNDVDRMSALTAQLIEQASTASQGTNLKPQ